MGEVMSYLFLVEKFKHWDEQLNFFITMLFFLFFYSKIYM